ncbi:MAG: hypothetical protein IPO17_09525 [Flavobacteriales bacterium]|nr:hypothetical protein [Flavobacteriales bacterium]
MARTQNLVPNPSFETVTSCPTFASMLNLAAPWYNPTQGTPELYHGCAPNGDFAGVPLNYSGGFQYARTGVGFAGIYTFRVGVPQMREYIEVPLLQPLMAGSCYTFSMYVNMPNEFELACDGIGAHFSVGPVSSNSPFLLAITPQIDHPLGVLITDTVGWTEVSGTYTATGGETHLTIGNFRNDANTTWAMFNPGVWYVEQAYLLVDDVSLVPVLDELDLGPDTALCGGSYTGCYRAGCYGNAVERRRHHRATYRDKSWHLQRAGERGRLCVHRHRGGGAGAAPLLGTRCRPHALQRNERCAACGCRCRNHGGVG